MSDEFVVPDIYGVIEFALADPALCDLANQRMMLPLRSLLDDRSHDKPRASDAGNCALQVWARVHNRFDIPEDYDALARMLLGSMNGILQAALFSVGYEALHPGWRVECEIESDLDGVPGHIDIAIQQPLMPLVETATGEIATGGFVTVHVVELKLTFKAFLSKDEKESGLGYQPAYYQKLQAAIYATAMVAPTFSVGTSLPAMKANGEGKKRQQFDAFTENWKISVAEEIARLRRASEDAPPPADPQESWRCQSCRWSGCDRNRNPLANAALAKGFSVSPEQAAAML